MRKLSGFPGNQNRNRSRKIALLVLVGLLLLGRGWFALREYVYQREDETQQAFADSVYAAMALQGAHCLDESFVRKSAEIAAARKRHSRVLQLDSVRTLPGCRVVLVQRVGREGRYIRVADTLPMRAADSLVYYVSDEDLARPSQLARAARAVASPRGFGRLTDGPHRCATPFGSANVVIREGSPNAGRYVVGTEAGVLDAGNAVLTSDRGPVIMTSDRGEPWTLNPETCHGE